MLNVPMLPQPDDVSCGPTSLHAVYRYFGLGVQLSEVLEATQELEEGGTLAVCLGTDALQRGLHARLYSWNLRIFDPSWGKLSAGELSEKLKKQLQYKQGKKFQQACAAYLQYLELGGEICFNVLSSSLLNKYFSAGLPVLAGLSATYLYSATREYTNHQKIAIDDDIRGEPAGHFVVLCGAEGRRIRVADPWSRNPLSESLRYLVDYPRLLHAILLGVLTYDGNLLVISPHALPGHS